MKKLLLSASIFISFLAQSQNLVLTQAAYEPIVGDTSRSYVLDTTAFSSGLMVNSTGANHVWNYQTLVNTTTLVTSAYVSTTAVSASTNFPGCTVVQKQGSLNNFLKSTVSPTTQTEFMGISSPGLSMNFTNTAVMIRYPMTYGNSITDSFSGSFSFSTTSGSASGNATTTADGTGTLQLPNGVSYTNVLRVKSFQNITLSSGFFPIATVKQTAYNFYHASEKYPIFSINYTSMQMTGSSSPTVTGSATGHKNAFPVGLKENSAELISAVLFPNPANDFITISFSGQQITPESLTIYNQLGQKVINLPYSEQVNVQSLPSGIYYLEIQTDKGVVRKKLIKS